MTVITPVPVLPLVFTGVAILNPIGLVIAAAASITVGMPACYIPGRRGYPRAARVSAESEARLPAPISSFYSWSTDNVGTASILIAATPNPMFDYAGIIVGAGRVEVRRFLAGTFSARWSRHRDRISRAHHRRSPVLNHLEAGFARNKPFRLRTRKRPGGNFPSGCFDFSNYLYDFCH